MGATLHDVLGRWSDALRERTERQALILFIGDSITEGWSATSPANRWVQLVQDGLRARYPTPNNEAIGYLSGIRNATNFPGAHQPVIAGNVVVKTNAGVGYKAAQIGQTVGEISWFAMTASGGTWTVTYQGDTTPTLAWDISAEDFMDALNALPSIGGDIVSISHAEGIFDPLFPNPSRHWYPFWDVANGNITPGTVNATNLTGGTVSWGTWSQGGIAGSVTFPDLDADLIDVWVRRSDFTNPILVNVDGVDALSITTAQATEEDENEHYVYLGPGTHDVVFTEVNDAGFPCELGGLFAYKGDGPGGGYLLLDGGSWVQAPDSVPLSVTGDFGVRFRIDADDLTPSVIQHVMAKWNDLAVNERSWRAGLTTDGKLRLSWSTAGTIGSIIDATSAAHNLAPGDWVWITLDVNNGGQWQVKFYKATYDTYDHTAVPAWTLISTVDGATGPTSVFNGVSPFAIGNCFSILPGYFTGKVYAAVYLDGITGGATELANPIYGVGGQSDPDAAGNNYTDSVVPSIPTRVASTDPAFGIHCIEAARGGGTSLSSFAQSDTPPNTRISDWVTGFGPSLGVVALGVNDWATGVTVADYKARLQRGINEARLIDTRLPLILVSWFEPHPAYHYIPTADYDRYVRAMQLVANANPLCYHRMIYKDPAGTGYENNAAFRPANVEGGLIDTANGYGLHPGDNGSETIANDFLKTLVPYRPRQSVTRRGPTNPLRYAA